MYTLHEDITSLRGIGTQLKRERKGVNKKERKRICHGEFQCLFETDSCWREGEGKKKMNRSKSVRQARHAVQLDGMLVVDAGTVNR